jgi:hypothetical protein
MLFSTERRRVQLSAVPIAAALAILTLLSSGTAYADFSKEFSFDSKELSVGNLIGEVTVEASTSGKFEVVVDVRGEDATEERINFETDEGSEATLFVGFPVDESRRYVYPEMGRGKTNFNFGRNRSDNSVLGSLFRDLGRKKIEVSGKGRGLEIWADVTVRVPDGAQLYIRQGAGRIDAQNVDAKLNLDIHSGSINAENIGDELLCDTGSGHVDVHGVDGSVNVDTGSGHVDVSGVKGDYCTIDTGSGHVTLTDIVAS